MSSWAEAHRERVTLVVQAFTIGADPDYAFWGTVTIDPYTSLLLDRDSPDQQGSQLPNQFTFGPVILLNNFATVLAF